jgi:hypothetical protein
MDRERCLLIFEGYGAGPNMVCLVRTFCWDATMACRALGNYGGSFQAGQGITQGGGLSIKLFNILVDAVVREWVYQLHDNGDPEEPDLGTPGGPSRHVLQGHNSAERQACLPLPRLCWGIRLRLDA